MKIRYGFVTNSSSSCFIIKKKYGQYTLDEINAKLKGHFGHNGFSEAHGVITDSKDPEYVTQLFDEQCWDGNKPIDCPLGFEQQSKIEEELGIEWPSSLSCQNCPRNNNGSVCEYTATYVEKSTSADVIIIGRQNAISSDQADLIKRLFPGTEYYHLG